MMCGICGFVVSQRKGCEDWPAALRAMSGTLTHRGPDSQGYRFTQNRESLVGLGHRRLAVIDLSGRAGQPLGNEDDSILVVYNGEIYNYRELTEELKARGHRFKSSSDTETIVHLYEDVGDQCVERLHGMFAFALWNQENGRLVLARDPIGIKPLFYAFKNGNFYFASEIKALLVLDEVSRDMDVKAVDYYFTYGYIPGTRTVFRDIKKVPPASYLTYEKGQINVTNYWSIRYLPKVELSEEAIKGIVRDQVKGAVKRQLVSDVPIGVFLSGGLDSSIILTAMNMVEKNQYDTFSLGFTSGGKDEVAYASEVADHFRTNHHEFKVDHQMTRILPELLWHLDEPFFDNSIIPTYYISKEARRVVKVVLSGDGGDEIFGGYEWTRRNQYRVGYQKLPALIRNQLRTSNTEVDIAGEYRTGVISKIRRFLGDMNVDMETGFLRRTSVSWQFRQKLYSNSFKQKLEDFDALDYKRDLLSGAQVSDIREKMLYADSMSYLPDDCLFKVDRMSMAHGLEVRVPFLDKELVEFCAKVSFNHKIKGLKSKYILRKTFAPHLPKKILRQRKQGFTIPISAWLRGELGELASQILLSETFTKRNLFKQEFVKLMIDEHRNGHQELGHRIWGLVVFEIWARLYLDAKINSAPSSSLEAMVE